MRIRDGGSQSCGARHTKFKIAATFFQQLCSYSDAMTDNVFIENTWKTSVIDEKNMANMNFNEHKYVFISLGNITKYQYDIATWFMIV